MEPWPANPQGGHEENGSWPLTRGQGGDEAPMLEVAHAADEELAYAEATELFLEMLRRLQEQDPTAKVWRYAAALQGRTRAQTRQARLLARHDLMLTIAGNWPMTYSCMEKANNGDRMCRRGIAGQRCYGDATTAP